MEAYKEEKLVIEETIIIKMSRKEAEELHRFNNNDGFTCGISLKLGNALNLVLCTKEELKSAGLE